MSAFHPRIRALVVGACAIALVAIGAGGTLAASTTPTVYACYNASGQVAMASIAQCKLAGGGQLVSINTQGIPGPTGPTGALGPTGPAGSTGAPYAPTLVEWDFTVPECAAGVTPCPVTSTTVFPAGTRLTPVSGEITAISGSGVLTCLSSTIKVDTGDSNYLFDQQFNPAGAVPISIGAKLARTLTADLTLRAFDTLCGTASVPKPSVTGKVVLQVEYPPVVIP